MPYSSTSMPQIIEMVDKHFMKAGIGIESVMNLVHILLTFCLIIFWETFGLQLPVGLCLSLACDTLTTIILLISLFQGKSKLVVLLLISIWHQHDLLNERVKLSKVLCVWLTAEWNRMQRQHCQPAGVSANRWGNAGAGTSKLRLPWKRFASWSPAISLQHLSFHDRSNRASGLSVLRITFKTILWNMLLPLIFVFEM